jgi:hypothetical protein
LEGGRENIKLSTLSSPPNGLNSAPAPDLRSFVTITLAIWLALAFWLGARHTFIGRPGSPPILLLIAVVTPIVLFLLAFWIWRSFHNFVLVANLPLLVATQAWRFAGFGFLALNTLAWPAALGDMAIGLTAPWVALALSRRPHFAASKIFVAWNIFGIFDFAVLAIGAGAIAPLLFPSLRHMLTPQMATAAPMVRLPLVLIPTFAVPMFTIFHLVALFQARHFNSVEARK